MAIRFRYLFGYVTARARRTQAGADGHARVERRAASGYSSRMSSLPTLRVCFDPGAGTCVWAVDAAARDALGYDVSLAALPVTAETRARGEALVTEFDGSIDWDDPGGPSPWGAERRAAFEAAMRDFILTLRQELAGRYTLLE